VIWFTANRVFPRILYGDEHPYGRVVTEASLKAIARDDILAFHRAYFRPGRALITVIGDVAPPGVKPTIEKALEAWTKGGERPAFRYPAVPAPRSTTIYLVDKPVMYRCAGGSLWRYEAYGINPTVTVPGSGGQLVARNVVDCDFGYDAGTSTRAALVTMRLTGARDGESVTLMHQVHVENSP
jgi:hypothetical protein